MVSSFLVGPYMKASLCIKKCSILGLNLSCGPCGQAWLELALV